MPDHSVPAPGKGGAMNALTETLAAIPQHQALDLTQGGPTALIALNGQCYTLRITRQGKLILTK